MRQSTSGRALASRRFLQTARTWTPCSRSRMRPCTRPSSQGTVSALARLRRLTRCNSVAPVQRRCSPEKKRPGTALCRAQAFKGEEEMKYFERVFMMSQLEMPRVDKNHETWRFATRGRDL